MENEVLHLMSKKKKGVFGLVFSRLGLIFLLAVLQLNIFLSVFHWFDEYFRIFTVAQVLFSIIMLVYLFNCSMDATAKLTWLFLIMLFPVPTAILLWISINDIGHRTIKERVIKLIEESRPWITQDEEVFQNPELMESGTDDLCRYLNRSGNFPIYGNTEATFFPSGEEKFEAMMEELKKAESFIFMEYFIIEDGYMWGSILKVLAEKAKQGVDVRVMYDGMCEISLLSHDYPERMAQLGIKCKPFTPLTPFLSTKYNYRDHRKILVIDGKVAFNGGVNLADEYINRIDRFGHWKDTAVRLKGKAVESFTLMFLQMWNIDEAVPDWKEARVSFPQEHAKGYVMPYNDHPLDEDRAGENVYIDILYRAKDYVHIMTPYMILDNELENALKYAAERGVEVKIILPGIPDKKVAYALAKTHYRSLIQSGVRIYEYTPGFVHAKIFVSDDEKAVVGTINLDYRSLYHHFECATYLYRTDCISDIEADYVQTLEKCREVTEESIKQEKLWYRIVGAGVKVLSPLM